MENFSVPNLGLLDLYDIKDVIDDKNIFNEYINGEKDLEEFLSTEGRKAREEACTQVATNNNSVLNTENNTDNYNINTQLYDPVQASSYDDSEVCFDMYPLGTTDDQTDNNPANSTIYIDCNLATTTGYTDCNLVDDMVSPENARDMVSPCNSFASSHVGRADSGMDSPSSSLTSSHADKNEAKKDERMRLKRRRNNKSSRLSRQKRKKLELESQQKVKELGGKVEELQKERNEWKELANAIDCILKEIIKRGDQHTDILHRMMQIIQERCSTKIYITTLVNLFSAYFEQNKPSISID